MITWERLTFFRGLFSLFFLLWCNLISPHFLFVCMEKKWVIRVASKAPHSLDWDKGSKPFSLSRFVTCHLGKFSNPLNRFCLFFQNNEQGWWIFLSFKSYLPCHFFSKQHTWPLIAWGVEIKPSLWEDIHNPLNFYLQRVQTNK